MRVCLVSDAAFVLGDAAAGRLREPGRVAFRADDRAEGFGLDLGLVMGIL
jgi:hypothetical protein